MVELDRTAIARKIGRRIAKARECRRMSVAELATRSGVDERLLHRYEAGEVGILADELIEIALVLGLPVPHFLEQCSLCGEE
jgi:transcriptional regulator with XRE-family HTH domain